MIIESLKKIILMEVVPIWSMLFVANCDVLPYCMSAKRGKSVYTYGDGVNTWLCVPTVAIDDQLTHGWSLVLVHGGAKQRMI